LSGFQAVVTHMKAFWVLTPLRIIRSDASEQRDAFYQGGSFLSKRLNKLIVLRGVRI